MSNLDLAPSETPCGGTGATAVPAATREVVAAREVPLGGPRAMPVRRSLPARARSTVGAWCFVDHFGPVGDEHAMVVPPHPHIGLQTVTWLLAGEVVHHDSVGSVATIRPGQLNLMTSGHGIAHGERSGHGRPPPAAGPAGTTAAHPPGGRDALHGVQLWVALPRAASDVAPHFEHHAELPAVAYGGAVARVLVGEHAGARSPATTYSPLVGVELEVPAGAALDVPLAPDFEHGVVLLTGAARVAGAPARHSELVYLGACRSAVDLVAGPSGARLLLLGGEPFAEELVMWWNFVGRDHDEIVAARADWEAGRRFGEVPGWEPGSRLAAPALPAVRLRPRQRPGG